MDAKRTILNVHRQREFHFGYKINGLIQKAKSQPEMHTLNFRMLLVSALPLATFWCMGCASHPTIINSADCNSSGIASVINRKDWSANQVSVMNSVVEFNYYASMFADTISSITNVPVDSLILFDPKQSVLNNKKNRSGRHSLFLSAKMNGYYFIEQVQDYTASSRPQFGLGTLYLIKCTGNQASVVFEKIIDYN